MKVLRLPMWNIQTQQWVGDFKVEHEGKDYDLKALDLFDVQDPSRALKRAMREASEAGR